MSGVLADRLTIVDETRGTPGRWYVEGQGALSHFGQRCTFPSSIPWGGTGGASGQVKSPW
jgi:hypothetical protein